MKLRRHTLVMLVAGTLVGAQTVLSLMVPRCYLLTVFGDLAQSTLLLLGLLIMYSNAARNRGRARFFWALMASGFALWLASQLLWAYYEVLARHEVPNPFIGDVVIVIHLVPMMGALTLQLQAEQSDDALHLSSVDVALLLFWWLYLYLFTVIPWQYVVFDEGRYGQSFNSLYLLEHIVFLASVGLLWLRGHQSWRKVHGNLFGAAVLYSLAFYTADLAIDLHRYYTGSPYDIPLVASIAWFVWVGVVAYQVAPEQERKPEVRAPGPWASRLATVAMLSIPLMGLWQVFDSGVPQKVRDFRVMVSLGAMFLLAFLVFLKQHLLNRELAGLLQRSQESLEDQQRLQSQLVQSEKLASLGQLVAGAAHEINNPLTAILGFSDLLAESKALPAEPKQLADKIGQQARRTKELVSNLLDFARQTPTKKTLLDVNSVLQTALKLSQPRLRQHNVRVQADLGLKLPDVSGDRNQLLQVFLHLIRNAIDAMQAKGEGVLMVSTRRGGGDVVIEFSDTGTGLAAPERVFDPFYTTRPVGQGSGLGLSACYGVIQDHRGRISCRNRPEGGANFEVRLPVATMPSSGAREVEQPVPQA